MLQLRYANASRHKSHARSVSIPSEQRQIIGLAGGLKLPPEVAPSLFNFVEKKLASDGRSRTDGRRQAESSRHTHPGRQRDRQRERERERLRELIVHRLDDEGSSRLTGRATVPRPRP